ncbi:ZEB2-regulated ABC transporter 1 [Colletotrichum spaethianum]|uniref:ZEB2-regulated ABC transporter 1 n=1 Tax=Colletotrichum spaethianum TaxID=700344 RepID=A0AA37PFP3_9PEZI|nr:ZEB2-regulated ABC transporter 1 [Colletotrichum spaethianum]GKT51446.1 ZEB2-regulated ABC transporter 1 [Colletotrichum spaethianum]
MPFRVIVIGGGLAGNLLGCGLMRDGVDVQVYERAVRHSNHEGLQIRLTAPALVGLRTCLERPHMLSIIKKFGPTTEAKAEAPRVFHKDWSLLIDLSRFPAYGKNAPISRGLLRDCLADPLYNAGKLKYEAALERYEILHPGTDEERVRIWLSDGSYDDCDVLIGADGSYSKVNRLIGLNSLDYIPKHVTIAAKCGLPAKRFLSMSKELVGAPIMCWADNKHMFFGVYLPNKQNDGSQRKGASDADSTKAYDEDLASCMISLVIEKDMLPEDIHDRSLDAQYDFMAETVKDWAPPFHEMIDLMRGAPLHIYTPRVAKQPSKNWRKKVENRDKPGVGHPRIWVMGDAVHAMLPPRGMGGNQAMLDAGHMLPFLTDLASRDSEKKPVSTEDIRKAVNEFENEMIPRAFNWVKKSGGDNFIRLFNKTPAVDETPEFNWH